MKRITAWAGLAATLALGAAPAQATVINLFEYGLHIDGVNSFATDPLPGGVAAGGFDFASGLGSLSVTVSGASDHNVIAYFDHEIDQTVNTFFNELGGTGGALGAGQSWEIDEPGFLFGDIYDNWQAGSLDNSNALDIAENADDVSMALGFDFTLAASQTAVVTFFLDVINNAPAFFLTQFDPDSIAAQLAGPNQLFFWATLEIRGDEEPPTGVPEPGTLLLLAGGLLALARVRRTRLA